MTELTNVAKLALGDKALELVEHLFGRRSVPVHDVIPPGLGSSDQGLGSAGVIVTQVGAMCVRPIQRRFNSCACAHAPWRSTAARHVTLRGERSRSIVA